MLHLIQMTFQYLRLKKLSRKFTKAMPDMQGLITRGHGKLKAAKYVLLRIDNAQQAKEYLRTLMDHHIATGKRSVDKKDAQIPPDIAVHLAFTSSGLRAIGINEEVINTFSREFVEGMTYVDPQSKVSERAVLLGDLNNNAPDKWIWGHDANRVDCVLMLYATDEQRMDELMQETFHSKNKGVTVAHIADTLPFTDDKNLKEHFGFSDGISQPLMAGSKKVHFNSAYKKMIEPGEFVLGFKNEYRSYSASPVIKSVEESKEYAALPGFRGMKDLGKNGTYLVFRQMEQHVEKFWKYLYQNSKETGDGAAARAIKLGAKMIGRWPDGRPLTLAPEANDVLLGDKNDFLYADEDGSGAKCPFGAHIRRTNPRDQAHAKRNKRISWQMSKRHRMLRRGRIYGSPLDDQFDIKSMIEKTKASAMWTQEENHGWVGAPVRGLHFICLVSDIARQFEFVQNVWANTATFGNLCNEVDPIISPRPTESQPECHEFTAPKNKLRNRYTKVPEFTTVIGGAYFFLPGIRALKYILKP